VGLGEGMLPSLTFSELPRQPATFDTAVFPAAKSAACLARFRPRLFEIIMETM
jgi:hypothetical protein